MSAVKAGPNDGASSRKAAAMLLLLLLLSLLLLRKQERRSLEPTLRYHERTKVLELCFRERTLEPMMAAE